MNPSPLSLGRTWLSLVALLLLGWWPGAQVAAQAPSAGDTIYSVDHGGLLRRYLVHVPRNYDPGRATPLLMAFHGGGGNMQFQADDENYGLIGKSEATGFILVFPNGYSPWPGGRFATWNAGN